MLYEVNQQHNPTTNSLTESSTKDFIPGLGRHGRGLSSCIKDKDEEKGIDFHPGMRQRERVKHFLDEEGLRLCMGVYRKG